MRPAVRLPRSFVSLLLGAAATAMFAGCQAGGFSTGPASQKMTDTQLAAFAAKSTYPTESRSAGRLPVAAIVARGTVKVYNFSDQPIRDAKVWVNQTFVTRVDNVQPLQHATIRTEDLYDQAGNTLSKQKLPISRVELETAEGFFALQGPAAE